MFTFEIVTDVVPWCHSFSIHSATELILFFQSCSSSALKPVEVLLLLLLLLSVVEMLLATNFDGRSNRMTKSILCSRPTQSDDELVVVAEEFLGYSAFTKDLNKRRRDSNRSMVKIMIVISFGDFSTGFFFFVVVSCTFSFSFSFFFSGSIFLSFIFLSFFSFSFFFFSGSLLLFFSFSFSFVVGLYDEVSWGNGRGHPCGLSHSGLCWWAEHLWQKQQKAQIPSGHHSCSAPYSC
jgi:hypothetical protein